MIKLENVNIDRIAFSAPGCEDWIYLTPEETFNSMRELQRSLFAWHELTGRKLYEMVGD